MPTLPECKIAKQRNWIEWTKVEAACTFVYFYKTILRSYGDLETLMGGLIQTAEMLEQDNAYDPVLAAAVLAFGFVFIHPFADGIGRLHRYLTQHMLHRKALLPKEK